MTLAQLLGYALYLDWPQVLYRSPVSNERYIIQPGAVAWQTWAASSPIDADLPRVAEVLNALRSVAPVLAQHPRRMTPCFRCTHCGLELAAASDAAACLVVAPERSQGGMG